MRTVSRRRQLQRAKARQNSIPAHDQPSKRRDEELRMNNLMKFVKLKPPKFEGQPDPVAAERWLNTIKEMLKTTKIDKSYWVGFAIYLFEGFAEDWFDLKFTHCGVESLKWKKFEKLFREAYTPDYGQNHMTVADYYPRFLKVSHHDSVLMADPILLCDKFRSTLRRCIKSKLARFGFTDINELYDAALKVEADLQENGRVRKQRKELEKLMQKDQMESISPGLSTTSGSCGPSGRKGDKTSPVTADEQFRSISSSLSAKLQSHGDVEGQLRGQSSSQFTATLSSVTRTQPVGLLCQNASSC